MTSAALALIEYPTTEGKIAEVGTKYAALEATTPKGYKAVVEAIAVLRGTRTDIEKRRVELKADALEFGRKVDAAAKKLTGLVADIEDPLKAKKQAVDDEAARVKREAEKAELVALEAKLRAEREAAEAKAKVEREKEEARLKAQREEQAAAQKKIDDERKALDEQKRAQAKEAARLEAARVAALPPAPVIELPLARPSVPVPVVVPVAPRPMAVVTDLQEVRAFAYNIRALAEQAPTLDGPCADAISWAVGRLLSIATGLDAFKLPDVAPAPVDGVPIT